MDRKHYSKKREEKLWSLVDRAITDFRILVLKGELNLIGVNDKEEFVYKYFRNLADEVCDEYRRSYASNSTANAKIDELQGGK